ncbi:MAG: HIT domain-containing protein [Candidatus Nanoarchaeia archaeon]|nr:HIT domain-containing protein [Candidatus Nanoarchaeia archaeon]
MCIFCDIANKKIQSEIIYEDADLLAFLDIDPINIGHTLIIPKKHSENFLNDENFNQKALILASKISKILLKEYDGVNILMNTNKAAGQEVFHTHMHVIPRIQNDNSISFIKTKKDNNKNDYIKQILKEGLND